MWQKYYWKKNLEEIVGLYSYCSDCNKEEYFLEIIFRGRKLINIRIMNRLAWIKKWDYYYHNLEMKSIIDTINYDDLLWKFYS